ncbi:MAG: ParB N-terminal domain-containing protein [Spirochaetales bacterium]|nr:ParB N-terminal domain-containing protein [Spirochaetales bacterium]
MQVEIASIRIHDRIRKDLDEIDDLADSMKRFGQFHPIVITSKNVLIAGRRRLAAAKALGWATIEATVAEPADAMRLLEMEIEENVQRSPLKREELEDAYAKLDRLRHPGFFRRLWNAISAFFYSLFHASR